VEAIALDAGINAVLLVAGSLAMCAGTYALARGRRKPAAEAEAPRSSPVVSDELELLRYENAMLRAEQQRTLSLGKAGERSRERLANVVTSGTDEGDDAWSTLTEATVLRDTLLAVCQDLQNALRHVQVQLSSGVPITELDRRKTDREPQPAAAGEGSRIVIPRPDRTRLDVPMA
jgi:hypothetical protein